MIPRAALDRFVDDAPVLRIRLGCLEVTCAPHEATKIARWAAEVTRGERDFESVLPVRERRLDLEGVRVTAAAAELIEEVVRAARLPRVAA